MLNAQSFIKEINIQISNRCNLFCIFCPRSNIPAEDLKKIEKTGFMPLNLFREIVDRAVTDGVSIISLTPRMGEVLLDPTLLEKLKYLEECEDIESYFFATNLTVDASSLIDFLQESQKFTLEISHYGNLNKFLELTHGSEHLYKVYIKNLCRLAARLTYKSKVTIFKRFVGEDDVSIIKLLRSTGIKYDDRETKNFNIGGLLKNDVDEHGEIVRKGECPTKMTGSILINGDYNLCYMNDVYNTMTQGSILHKSLKELRENAVFTGHECCRLCNECW